MKYGLVYYKYTDNMGDDILSYAAKRFLPHVDYYIDRERMDAFTPNETEHVAVILNGWFLHHTYAFPPSPYLIPLFIGTHFGKDYTTFANYSWLDGYVAEYLHRYEPIGCRDKNTLQAMQERQIESFFSGCLTMTLEPFPGIEKTDRIVLTDVSADAEAYIRNFCPHNEIICKTHTIEEPDKNKEWSLREQQLEENLKLYQSAKLVITTRLHCALPSIALGTPVILIGNFNDDFHDRIADYTKYFKCFDIKAFLSGEADPLILNSFENGDISALRKALIHSCKDFITRTESMGTSRNDLPTPEQYQELYVKRTSFVHRSMDQLIHNHAQLLYQYKQEHEKYVELSELSQKLMTEYQRLLNTR